MSKNRMSFFGLVFWSRFSRIGSWKSISYVEMLQVSIAWNPETFLSHNQSSSDLKKPLDGWQHWRLEIASYYDEEATPPKTKTRIHKPQAHRPMYRIRKRYTHYCMQIAMRINIRKRCYGYPRHNLRIKMVPCRAAYVATGMHIIRYGKRRSRTNIG